MLNLIDETRCIRTNTGQMSKLSGQSNFVVGATMITRILFALLLFHSISAHAEDSPDAAHRKIAFLCDWSQTRMPGTPGVLCDAEAMAGASDTW
jgi:hypothetical protein